MMRYRQLIAAGLTALCICAASIALAQTPTAEALPASAAQHEDNTVLSDRVSRVEGQLEGMEAANDQATRHVEGVLATVRWCTIVVSGLITLIGILLGALGYKSWKSVRDVTKEADAAVKKADDSRRKTETAAQQAEEALHQAEDAARRVDEASSRIEGTASDFWQRIQAEAEQRLRALDEIVSRAGAVQQDRQTLWSLAQILISGGNLTRGAELLEKVAEHDLQTNQPDVNVLNQLSGLLDQLGRYEDAVKYADIAISKFRDDVAAWFNKSVIEIHRGGAAADERGKRRHWREALESFSEARRLHKAGTRMNDADHGKMWLFTGETAQYTAELGPTPEIRSDWLQKAAAWYNDGYVFLLEARGRATEGTAPLIGFWANNAHERTFKVHHVDRQADSAGLQRRDIARRDNDLPFWRPEDEAEFQRLVGLDDGSTN